MVLKTEPKKPSNSPDGCRLRGSSCRESVSFLGRPVVCRPGDIVGSVLLMLVD